MTQGKKSIWDDRDPILIECHEKGMNPRQIAEEIHNQLGQPIGTHRIHTRVWELRKAGRLPLANGSKIEPQDPKEADTAKKRTREYAPRAFWSDEEDVLMWELLTKDTPLEEIATALNARFDNNRTAKKIKTRVMWLKQRAKKKGPRKSNTPPSASIVKAPKSAAALARQDPNTMIEPVQQALPLLAEQRHVRIDFPQGAIALSVSGDVPDRVKNAINQILWS